MDPLQPIEFYQSRITELSSIHLSLKKRHSATGWARLIVFLLAIVTIVYLWPYGLAYAGLSLIPFIAIFLILVTYSLRIEEQLRNTGYLVNINRNELRALNHDYRHFYNGDAFIDHTNAVQNDLDLFGDLSLYQYINRAGSEQGREMLAGYLSNFTNKEAVLRKQEAVKEVLTIPEWRQQLHAYNSEDPVTKKSEDVIQKWITENVSDFTKPVWSFVRWVVPLISLTVLGLFLGDVIEGNVFYPFLFFMFIFAYLITRKVTREYGHLSKIVAELESLLPSLRWIENQQFTSSLLKEIQGKVSTQQKASTNISSLKNILDRFDYRLNPLVHLPLNIFLLWDLQQAIALEKWKQTEIGEVKGWFETLGELEAISSLANLKFNHPDWIFPVIMDDWFSFEIKDAAHPQIPESRVVKNDIHIDGTPQVTLITGSNMAGKSTFLRTIGVNIILAMAGAPVRARNMKLPVTKVMSSMRITDNLAEETSTFYAELKKLKNILNAVQQKEKVFLLLDEMLRGTNSIDRHTGSVAFIRQLIKNDAVGMIASHDIALAELQNEFPSHIHNYHFDSTIINNEIVFDYKLKPGVCKSTNASLLMKKIGIEM